MEIWIIRDGEKKGPFHDFEIRKKIGNGELPADTPAWHEGLGAWKPLVEIDIFSREFEREASAPIEPARVESAPVISDKERLTPPPLPVPSYYARRFWARWFDLTFYAGVWWLGMWAARQNIEAAVLNPWVMLFRLVPWFIIEILLIHYFATTPGKWLLGLRVTNADGSKLDLTASALRALRVLFTGIGFGWDLLAIFCQALSYFTAKRLGRPLWDHAGNHQVTAAPLSPFRLIALVFLFFGAVLLQLLVLSPYLFEMTSKSSPEFKQKFERNPFWHLPKRSY